MPRRDLRKQRGELATKLEGFDYGFFGRRPVIWFEQVADVADDEKRRARFGGRSQPVDELSIDKGDAFNI